MWSGSLASISRTCNEPIHPEIGSQLDHDSRPGIPSSLKTRSLTRIEGSQLGRESQGHPRKNEEPETCNFEENTQAQDDAHRCPNPNEPFSCETSVRAVALRLHPQTP